MTVKKGFRPLDKKIEVCYNKGTNGEKLKTVSSQKKRFRPLDKKTLVCYSISVNERRKLIARNDSIRKERLYNRLKIAIDRPLDKKMLL